MSFDALAPHYRWMEFVLAGQKLQRCRTAFLDRVAGSRNILAAGEGNGRFLSECAARLPAARIAALDLSGGMLAAARRRADRLGARSGTIEFIHADVLAWTPRRGAYDVIVTHFFLDCFPADQLKRVIATLGEGASPAAAWLLADFQIPAAGWPRFRARTIHALMYTFFRAATRLAARALVPPDDLLAAQGFRLRERRASDWGLLHTDLWERGR